MRVERRIFRTVELWALTLAVVAAFDIQLVLLLIRVS